MVHLKRDMHFEHSRVQFVFQWSFRVSSFRERAVQPWQCYMWQCYMWKGLYSLYNVTCDNVTYRIGDEVCSPIELYSPANITAFSFPHLQGYRASIRMLWYLLYSPANITAFSFPCNKLDPECSKFRFLFKWGIWKETCDDHSHFHSNYQIESHLNGLHTAQPGCFLFFFSENWSKKFLGHERTGDTALKFN